MKHAAGVACREKYLPIEVIRTHFQKEAVLYDCGC